MTSMPATCWSTTDCSAVASHRSPLRQGMITESHGVSIISSHHYSTVDRYTIIETPCRSLRGKSRGFGLGGTDGGRCTIAMLCQDPGLIIWNKPTFSGLLGL